MNLTLTLTIIHVVISLVLVVVVLMQHGQANRVCRVQSPAVRKRSSEG